MVTMKTMVLENILMAIAGCEQTIINAHASMQPWEFGYLRGQYDALIEISHIIEDDFVKTKDELLRLFDDQIDDANHKLLVLPINVSQCDLSYIKGNRQAILQLYSLLRDPECDE